MMNNSHTEDEIRERAALYALGGLNQFEARAFEQHLDEGCEECAAELASFDSVVEELAWADAVASPPQEVRARLLARVALEPRHEAARPPADLPARPPRHAEEELFDGEATLRMKRPAAPKPAAPGMLIIRAGEGAWRETADAGVHLKVLFFDRDTGLYTTLLRMSPGSRLQPHRHTGTEQCLVLEGELRAGDAHASAGDYICAMPGSVHEELTTDTGALLLLVSPGTYEVIA
jgi:anti-sigma factor ChrR (cupin superfamily)